MGFFGGGGGAAGVGGATGATDNAILRADGTGGTTLQGSDLNVDDATTTTQNNVAISNQHSGQTNSALVLTPKGTGALIVGPKPEGTATGGNARGQHAVDFQIIRASAGQVASGKCNFIAGGERNTTSGESSFCANYQNTSSGWYSSSINFQNTSSGDNSFCCGVLNTASGNGAFACGRGAQADRILLFAYAGGRFSANGDAQKISAVLRNKTTTNSAVELFMGATPSDRLSVPSGKVMSMVINITGAKSDGSAVAHYVRQYSIKNVGGTTSEVYAPVTIGTDNAAGTSITVDANDTNDALRIQCTGVASETWRWVASVDAVEVAYGT